MLRRAVHIDVAAEKLGLKKTTAINIIRRFEETGTLPKRKFRKEVREDDQEGGRIEEAQENEESRDQ